MTSTSAAPRTPRPHALNEGFVWRDPDLAAPRRLSPEQRAQFSELGFLKVEQVFAPAEIAAVTAAIDPFEAEAEAALRDVENHLAAFSRDGMIAETFVSTQRS